MEIQDKTRAWLEVTRQFNSLFAGVATGIGCLLGGIEAIPALAAFSATYLGTCGGNSINDYFDVDIDEINNPSRPIPSGRLGESEVLVGSSLLFATAVLLTVLVLPLLAIGIGLFNLLVMVVYSSHLKRMPLIGNLAVGYLTGSAFLFGGAAVGGVEYTAVLFLLASLVTLGREIIKDIEDIKGDREMDARTLPVIYGEKAAYRVASASVILGVALSPLPLLQREVFGYSYIVAATPAIALFIYSLYIGRTDVGRSQSLIKIGMFIALFAFLVGRFTGF